MGDVIYLKEGIKLNRAEEPINISLPFKKGEFFDKNEAGLFDGKKEIDSQKKIFSRWNDGSIKWMLFDFKADKHKKISIGKGNIKEKKIAIGNIDLFVNNIKIITKAQGQRYCSEFKDYSIEEKGEIKTELKYKGSIKGINHIARFSFYNSGKLIKLEFTIRNPKAAEHKDGFWDLGDKGSIRFDELNLELNLSKEAKVYHKKNIKEKFKKSESICLYAESSKKKIQPVILLKDKNFSITLCVKDFWQNYPKKIEAEKDKISIGLFPKQDTTYELQGGEQKTHTIWFDLEGKDLDWVNAPLEIRLDPEYLYETKAIPYFTSLENCDKRYQTLIECAITGNDSFEKKNKKIDEYGWRNFGDIYADHESVQKKIVSHYNNQYDVINGAILQFLRSGDFRWFKIADDMAKHVRDIDVYHTSQDKPAYNGGMFWHTFHYVDAGNSTHRSYPRNAADEMGQYGYGVGGGPSNEHNYATGLMNHYFLTGDKISKETVLGLADWVIRMDDGRKSKLRFFGGKYTGKASQSGDIYYHGPGRGSGNSINVSLDGFEVSSYKKYLLKAEQLIRRCIHPKDCISKNHLEDVEHRWFYLVFLQALGRYLDVKAELDEIDYMFYYAKESLLHYARWILYNESPYKDVLHKVEIPTETWPAQDIRKTIVLDFAYKYSGDERFKAKAQFFYDRCIEDLNSFDTKTFTRPIAILMHYSVMHDWFRQKNEIASFPDKKIKFGRPKKFRPQGYILYKTRDRIRK